MRGVSIITDHKLLVAIFKKDMGTPQNTPIWSQNDIQAWPRSLYGILVIQINHKLDKDEEIEGMQVNVNNTETSTNIPECMMIHELQHETDQDNHLQQLKECMIK